jgi:hypothetical protein
MVIGIPTVKRQYQSYLVSPQHLLMSLHPEPNQVTTLQSVLENMTADEMEDSLIIIFIAETDPDSVYQISNDVQKQFSQVPCSPLDP